MVRPSDSTGTHSSLWVYQGDRFAGTLRMQFTVSGVEPVSSTFTYDPTYITSAEARPLSPELILKRSPQHSGFAVPSFGAFSDAAPDRWGRRLIWEAVRESARLAGTNMPTVNLATYLLSANDESRIGDLRFFPAANVKDRSALPAAEPEQDGSVASVSDLHDLLSAVDDFTHNREVDPRAARLLLSSGTEMGGARPKVVMRLPNGALAVAKFPHPDDRWDVELWEAITAQLARDAGIITAETDVRQLGPERSVLLARRFDRGSEGQRLGYWSARTLMMPVGDDPLSYTVFAERLTEVVGSPRPQLHQLFRRIAFTLLVNNVDDHLRNHALIHDGQWRLSPAFDVNPHVGPPVPSTPIFDGGERQHRTAGELLDAVDWFELTRRQEQRFFGKLNASRRHGAIWLCDSAPTENH